MMKSRKIHLFILVLILTGTSEAATAQESVDVELQEVLVIGDNPDQGSEYWFVAPQHLRTDSDGNMYITDYNRSEIRVYDPSGTYLRSIGRGGEGPGEFQEITAFHIDEEDRLIIFDRTLQRFTIYDKMGNDFSTILNEGEFLGVMSLRSFGRDHYLLNYRDWTQEPEEAYMMHLYDRELNYTGESFLEASQIWDLNIPFFRSQVRPGRSFGGFYFSVDRSSDILVCQFIYENIYRFTPGSGGEWTRQEMKGTLLNDQSFLQLSWNRSSEYRNNGVPVYSSSGSAGQFAVVQNSGCTGVASLSNGLVVLFSYQRTDDRNYIYNHYLDLFDENNTHLGGKLLKTTEHEPGIGINFIRLLWANNDTLYVRETIMKDGIPTPVIRVLTLDG